MEIKKKMRRNTTVEYWKGVGGWVEVGGVTVQFLHSFFFPVRDAGPHLPDSRKKLVHMEDESVVMASLLFSVKDRIKIGLNL